MNEIASPKASPSAMAQGTLVEAEAFLTANPDLAFVDALFIDICGRARGKRFPYGQLRKLYGEGIQIPFTIYLLDVTGDTHDPGGHGFSDGDPDGTAFPCADRLRRVTWTAEPSAQVLMSLYERPGVPAAVEPRAILGAVLARFAELRLKPVVAFELEFYLIAKHRLPSGAPIPATAPGDGRQAAPFEAYGLFELDRYAGFIEAVEKACRAQGLPASALSSEMAPGQFEVNLVHTDDAIAAADQAALLRHLIVNVARAEGFDATFMAKPFAEANGSGMHVHISLVDDAGRNVFREHAVVENLKLRNAIGGLRETLDEAFALFAPNMNAYRRFAPRRFVPVNSSWAVNNRSAAFRIPAGPAASRRVEHRVSAADANPYLVLAAILTGMHYGLVNDCDPGAPGQGNLSATPDPSLPSSLDEALDRLVEARILRAYLGDSYVDVYRQLKTAELAKFRRTVSPQEFAWYL